MNIPDSELLTSIFRNVKDHALMVVDPQGVITGWFWGAEEILGYTAEEAIGTPISHIFVPEDLAKKLDTHELEVARVNSRSDDERWHIRKDGTRIWASGSVVALRNDSGRLIGFVKILRDRTDKRIQTEAIGNQATGLREALDRTHRFLQTLGHEMRNPLSPIKTCAHLLERLSTNDRIRWVAKTIETQAAVLERMAGDLMEVSRLHHRKLTLQRKRLDLCDLLHGAVTAASPAATAKGLELVPLLPRCPLWIEADRDRLQQVISNLLTNAIKYTPQGGKIWVKATEEADEAVMRVEDTGIGISPEMLPRIFDLFTQESRAEDLVPGGLGIGLAVVREIVELHGGVVQARSSGTGKGAEFSVRLPLNSPPVETLPDPRNG